MRAILPSSHTIAILGAGAMGLCTALALQKDGHHITLYDPKGFPAHNASFIAGGMLVPYTEIDHMDLLWAEAGLRGIALWQEMLKGHETQADFHCNGSLILAHPQDRYILERFLAHLPEPMRRYTPVKDIEPALADRFAQGVFIESEAHLHPAKVLPLMCEMLKTQGAVFLTEAANPEDLSPRYDVVLDCRGLGSRQENTLRGVKGEIVIVRNPAITFSRPVRIMHPRYPLFVVPRREDHIFLIGATQIESEGAHVSLRSAMELMSALYALHPSFGEAEIVDIQAGVRPTYPDNLPRITRNGNIIACNGLFRHGFLLSPVMAACVADDLAGRNNPHRLLFQGQTA